MMMMILWSAVHSPLGRVSATAVCVCCRGNISYAWGKWKLKAEGMTKNRPQCLRGDVNNELVVLRDGRKS